MAKISVYSIGRSNDADIQLSDPTVSRIHAELVITAAGKYYLTDCASSGGTYTMQGNDKPVLVPTELEDRARITLGNTSLMLIPLCGDSFDWRDIEDGDADEQT